MAHDVKRGSRDLTLGEWLRQYHRERVVRRQADYITRRLAEEFAEQHVSLLPGAMSDAEVEEFVAEMLAHARYLAERRAPRGERFLAAAGAGA